MQHSRQMLRFCLPCWLSDRLQAALHHRQRRTVIVLDNYCTGLLGRYFMIFKALSASVKLVLPGAFPPESCLLQQSRSPAPVCVNELTGAKAEISVNSSYRLLPDRIFTVAKAFSITSPGFLQSSRFFFIDQFLVAKVMVIVSGK